MKEIIKSSHNFFQCVLFHFRHYVFMQKETFKNNFNISDKSLLLTKLTGQLKIQYYAASDKLHVCSYSQSIYLENKLGNYVPWQKFTYNVIFRYFVRQCQPLTFFRESHPVENHWLTEIPRFYLSFHFKVLNWILNRNTVWLFSLNLSLKKNNFFSLHSNDLA